MSSLLAYRSQEESRLVRHLKDTVPRKYHEMLTPDYGIGCKRRIFDDSWFLSLSDPRVELTNHPIKELCSNGVQLGDGRVIPADVIILANGYDMSTWLHSLKIIGKHGKSLHEIWNERGGPQAYMGTAMDGFPNFFMIHGPNVATGHSSIILQSENMVMYSMKFIRKILAGDLRVVEVKTSAELSYSKDIRMTPSSTIAILKADVRNRNRFAKDCLGKGWFQ